MQKHIDWMTEIPEKCNHPDCMLTEVRFDIMDQPYRTCKKCGSDICGRDALNALKNGRKLCRHSKK